MPCRPIATEEAAITAGPVRNLTAMANAAMEFPQAISFGCKAMNIPIYGREKEKLLRKPKTKEQKREVRKSDLDHLMRFISESIK